MSTTVLLPKIGFSENSAHLVEWLALDGVNIAEGQPLYALENDKTIQEIEAPASGKLKILAAAGQDYEVGTVLAEIV